MSSPGRTPATEWRSGSSRLSSTGENARVGTFSYEFDVKLTSGTEATVAEVPKPSGGSMSLSIAATIQD